MRIALLCNDRLGLPALQQLLQERMLVAVGSADRISETTALIAQLCRASGIPFHSFFRQDLEADLQAWLALHQPDVVLVKTFPWRIPADALKAPKYGFINFHYAPLPEWRGANPLFWMIRDRVMQGGVTVHRMDAQIDTGEILMQQPVQFNPEMTFGMVTAQLAFTGLALTGPLLQGLLAGSLLPQPQQEGTARWYGRPKPDDLFIKWGTQSGRDVMALVNACNPWNKGAAARFKGWTFGITALSFSDYPVAQGTASGTILTLDEKNGLLIAAADGKALRVDVIYCEEGFFPGYRIALFGLQQGDRLDVQ